MNEMIEAKPQSTALSPLEAKIAAKAEKLRQAVTVTGNAIKINKAKQIQLPNDETVEQLPVVILDYRYYNAFFPKPFRKGEFSPPVCQAVGETPDDKVAKALDVPVMAPVADCPQPQAESCSACPMNEFGSALNGGRGKACRNTIVLAVMLPSVDESDDVYRVIIQPTSTKKVEAYLSRITETYGHPIKAVSMLGSDASSDWERFTLSFVGANADYTKHAEFMTQAEKILTTVMKMDDTESATTTVTADTSTSHREPRRARG